MTYREKYDEFWDLGKIEPKNIKTRITDKERALKELYKVRDEEEVFKLDGYFEGTFMLRSEDGKRTIDIGFSCTAGVNLFLYNTIDDILKIHEGSTKIDFLWISVYK